MSPSPKALLRLAHSPDPDDAFMWWPLFERNGRPPALDTGRFRFVGATADIETLNQRSEAGDFEITAISCAQYPRVKDRYALTACGASMGEQYGPKLVSGDRLSVDDLNRSDVTIAIPGARTSAFITTCMRLGTTKFRHQVVPFETIIDRVADGTFAAGLIIHEGQLTYETAGLHLIEDLGAWWWREHQLPLPLGVNVIRRDLEAQHGKGTLGEVTALLRRSVEYALEHRAEAIEYALNFARGMSAELADRFVSMYVNKWTLDFGVTGRDAVWTFLTRAHEAGLLPAPGGEEFVEPAQPRPLPQALRG